MRRPWIGALLACGLWAEDPLVVPLWPNGAPGSEGKTADETVRIAPGGDHVVSGVHKPSIAVYRAPREAGPVASVIIAPGGGHRELWADHEGHNLAKFLSGKRVAAFVLKYRLAREKDSPYTIKKHAFEDMKRAIRLVRSKGTEWSIDPGRLGVMGFSAGGELAALAGIGDDSGVDGATDPIDKESAKPAFFALIYPALPKNMDVSKDTPPSFLVCGENDRLNISQGLPELYLALKKAGASSELHVYAATGHGFGVRDRNKGGIGVWPARFHEWLDAAGFLRRR